MILNSWQKNPLMSRDGKKMFKDKNLLKDSKRTTLKNFHCLKGYNKQKREWTHCNKTS